MSIRKVTICLAVILFISATVLAFTSNKRAEKKAEKEYTPTVQTVTMTAVGDCTLATDINAFLHFYQKYLMTWHSTIYLLQHLIPFYIYKNCHLLTFQPPFKSKMYYSPYF